MTEIGFLRGLASADCVWLISTIMDFSVVPTPQVVITQYMLTY